MASRGEAVEAVTGARTALTPLVRAVQWGLDRMVSVGYGVVYDYIVERFGPYRELHAEVLALLQSTSPEGVNRREVRVLDVACGTGYFTLRLAQAGFDTVGIDRYQGLVELAREKRRSEHMAHLAFRHGDLARGAFRPETFDLLVNIHSLYVHPEPEQLLLEAGRVLKAGGQAVFVNFTRRVHLWSTFAAIRRRLGLRAAFGCLLWVLPNAVFEATRKRVGPHYWDREDFAARLRAAGFQVLELRPAFFDGASLLAWVRREATEAAA